MVKAEEALAVILFLVGFKGKKKPPEPTEPPEPITRRLKRVCIQCDETIEFCALVEIDEDDPTYFKTIESKSFQCPNPLFLPPVDSPPREEIGCGPKPNIGRQDGAGYWWQPATDNVGWFATVETRPDSSVILSIHEAYSLELQQWYRCEQLTDPIRLITQFI